MIYIIQLHRPIIVYYSIGFTKLALEFGGKLAKVGVGRGIAK